VHKSKGLGYDQCVLINATDDLFGFPSKIEDEGIIKLLNPKINEGIIYPEERRLFYVALTRTKNKFYIVAPLSKASTFIEEIKTHNSVLKHSVMVNYEGFIMTKYNCPECDSYLRMEKYLGTNYWIYTCSNDKCDFKTSTPRKLIPIKKCPLCGDNKKGIVVYSHVYQKEKYVLKCINSKMGCPYMEYIPISKECI
jgi:DNA helicase-4